MRQAQGSLRSPSVGQQQERTRERKQTQQHACELQELGFATGAVAAMCMCLPRRQPALHLDPWLRFIPAGAGELRYSGNLCMTVAGGILAAPCGLLERRRFAAGAAMNLRASVPRRGIRGRAANMARSHQRRQGCSATREQQGSGPPSPPLADRRDARPSTPASASAAAARPAFLGASAPRPRPGNAATAPRWHAL
jgi:hypothetical protein